MTALDQTLAALADPSRRAIVDVLRQGPRPAGELAREMGMSPPTMSRALRALREAGLVAESHPVHDARVRIYELRAAPMQELRAWLEAVEENWATQLSAFKAHLERRG